MNRMKIAISEIVTSNDLREISLETVENVLDNEIGVQLLKEVPIVNILLALRKIYSSYTDRIFIKKAMAALIEIGDTDNVDRQNLLKELSDEDSNGSEKILMAINHLETIEKCRIFGRLCKLRVLGKISTDEFHRLTKIIQNSYIPDLTLIREFEKLNGQDIYEGEYLPLINLGLIYQVHSEQENIRYHPEGGNEYGTFETHITGGKVNFYYNISDIAKVLLTHLNELLGSEN